MFYILITILFATNFSTAMDTNNTHPYVSLKALTSLIGYKNAKRLEGEITIGRDAAEFIQHGGNDLPSDVKKEHIINPVVQNMIQEGLYKKSTTIYSLDGNVRSIHPDANGNLYISAGNRIYTYDKATNKLKKTTGIPNKFFLPKYIAQDPNNPNHLLVRIKLNDKDNVAAFDKSTNTFLYTNADGRPFYYIDTDGTRRLKRQLRYSQEVDKMDITLQPLHFNPDTGELELPIKDRQTGVDLKPIILDNPKTPPSHWSWKPSIRADEQTGAIYDCVSFGLVEKYEPIMNYKNVKQNTDLLLLAIAAQGKKEKE